MLSPQLALSSGRPAEPLRITGLDDIMRPNGLAISPDGTSLYISNSEKPPQRRWLVSRNVTCARSAADVCPDKRITASVVCLSYPRQRCELPEEIPPSGKLSCVTFAHPKPLGAAGALGSADGLKVCVRRRGGRRTV